MDTFGFEDALDILKAGGKVAREGWNGKGMHILHVPGNDIGDVIFLPYLSIQYPENHFLYSNANCPWTPSQTDLLSDDWYEVEG